MDEQAFKQKVPLFIDATKIDYLRTNNHIMVVERTENEIIVRLSPSVKIEDLQDFLDYARYKELTANVQVEQDEIDKMAAEINKNWWTENRDKLIK
jgi:mannitol-specific phosphotransferase system IIBC component